MVKLAIVPLLAVISPVKEPLPSIFNYPLLKDRTSSSSCP
jgi:hypothetical protein